MGVAVFKGAWAGATPNASPAKGALAFSTAALKLVCEIAGGAARRQPTWLPAATRIEKGIRNFRDAAIQSQ